MKKILMLAVLFAAVAIPAKAADSFPIKLSVWDHISIPRVDTVKGLDLSIVRPDTQDVLGLQLSLIWARTTGHMLGVQSGLLGTTDSLTGLQASFINMLDSESKGVQLGAVNINRGKLTGAALGFVNVTEDHYGFQWGAVNYAKGTVTGLQLGIVNYAETLDRGLQLGLVNLAKNGWLPVMIFVNGRF
ncbi:hypothetical protein Dip518_000179 [Parelusimicrobium proximum]|uniref:LA_2272 family surface repeat-containing protein n=1 Tax=Parelusimicrobium proximum TaxID=3228953 RepID=UPI003D17B711